VRGRYIQLRLTLQGTGRATPEIQSLRLWYPRFSYQEQYLPAIYGEDPGSAGLTERLLANFEGLYTDLEEEIVHVYRLFDPRTVPPETMAWLAEWLGVVLHPLWDEARRRFFIRFAHRLYTMRGTLRGLVISLRIFLDEELDESVFDPACTLRTHIRIVEHFLTRDVAGTVFGDPESEPAAGTTVAASAHRFSVLLPHRLEQDSAGNGDTLRMVERIVELEKPSHTWFDIREYWNMFRVGEARLGLDTGIGYSTFFQPLVLGDSILPNATLGCPYPLNVEDRFVMGRNQVG
jgi:phage tail-like protein